MGHVQDSPVSNNMIANECMIHHMKVHIVSYGLGQKIFSKSRIHILSNYGQTDKYSVAAADLQTSENLVCIFFP